MSLFTSALIVSPKADGKTWVILQPFGYDIGDKGSGNTVNVEVGFQTDFASIPRVLWWLLPKWGKYGNAAVIHDWLYWNQGRPRGDADKIMLEAMEVLTVPRYKRYAIYWAVRLFGDIAWLRNQWDKEAGTSRIENQTEFKSIAESSRPGMIKRTWQHVRNKRLGNGNKPISGGAKN